ncbi:alkene reductase [Sphingorhabdus lutea]|uniref:Alkene reductase n=1 Tax=Sphingorhabdus lutea TaxID=1913578 RepID=A0A1L3J9E9_9SPHN|nr:alkene reductase [Sphingorhabdus lutea]APG61745.1 alkene reductase [Sphingorhabdus lutea]
MTTPASHLLKQVNIGDLDLPNRIMMAPLTRGRADDGHMPNILMAQYYAQRAGAGLIISEATGISVEGLGWPSAPGIWNEEQSAKWKVITKAVHDAGGRIFCQLWHMGRLVHPDFLGGDAPVSASATCAPGHAHTPTGKKDYEMARSLDKDEIPRLLNDYENAAKFALDAGFDGVQLHAANGYLIDQFLRDNCNHRTDEYGGSQENRIRLLEEVTDRLIAVCGADRVAVRLSPNGETQGIDDSDPIGLFTKAAAMLNSKNIAFLELREPLEDGTFGSTDVPPVSPHIRKVFSGPLVLNSDYDVDRAEKALESGACDAVSFGRPYIANPDLAQRIAAGAHWNKDNYKTWYGPGPVGYTDYPAMGEE